jgi:serine/threonine protein kinase
VSKVHLCDTDEDGPVAIKEMQRTNVELGLYEREVKINKEVASPNVVAIIGHQITPDRYLLVFEAGVEDLFTRITRDGPIHKKEFPKLFMDLVSGLAAVHAQGIVHHDIKPENIIIFKDGTYKLADFGLAEKLDPEKELKTQKGTHRYLPQEVIRKEKHDQSVDVWALAVTLMVSMSGAFPYSGDEYAYTMEILFGEADLSPIADWNKEIQEVMKKMLSNDPKERPTAAWLRSWGELNLHSMISEK